MVEELLVVLIILVIVNIAIGLFKRGKSGSAPKLKEIETSILKFDATLERTERSIKDEFQRNRSESNQISKENREELSKVLDSFADRFSKNVNELKDLLRQNFGDFSKQQTDINKQATDNIKEVKDTVEKKLSAIRDDNKEQLGEMRKTVDEKLQSTLEKRLGESFKQVSERLEQVHKGLGEMQNIAVGVGDLKKVLSNVKTRGILGEYQLENILEQILSPGQYSKNVATKKGSQAHVEFAIRLPGKESDQEVWMPIDSKFPIETYHALMDAYEVGDTGIIESSQKLLFKSIKNFAKDISQKYLDPPHTTDFAVMFLPIEGLYAEILRHPDLFEILQRTYKITITGPTTLSALLSSLQMGFRTLAVQKRSSEVWKILEAVKTEFGRFSAHLDRVDKQLDTASSSLGELRSTRANVMNRKLKEVGSLSNKEAEDILEITTDEDQ